MAPLKAESEVQELKREGLGRLEGLLAIVGHEVMMEGIRTGTSTSIECDARNFCMISQRDLRAPATLTVARLEYLWVYWRVPSKIALDLSRFRAIPFAQNQTGKESIQRVRL